MPNMEPKPHHRRKQSHSHQQQKWQNNKQSYDYDTISVAPKCGMTQPAFGSSDKLLGIKCELNKNASNTTTTNNNNTECGVIETNDFQRHPLNNNPTVVDSTNRTASGLIAEEELFKCKNAKYSHVISKKEIVIDSHANHRIGKDTQINLGATTETSTKKIQAKAKQTKLRISHRSKKSTNALISRITDELNQAPIETFHKTLDFGERLFIEKFLALEISI